MEELFQILTYIEKTREIRVRLTVKGKTKIRTKMKKKKKRTVVPLGYPRMRANRINGTLQRRRGKITPSYSRNSA